MKSRTTRRALCLLTALSMSHLAILGHDARGARPASAVEHHLAVATAEEVVGGQAIDWVVCAVAGVGALFFPWMGLVGGPACYSAVVRTWG